MPQAHNRAVAMEPAVQFSDSDKSWSSLESVAGICALNDGTAMLSV